MKRAPLLFLALILLIGGMLRFYGLTHSPAGLWYDEALNGENTQRILAGERPIFFYPDGYPQEPLYFYLQAAVTAIVSDGQPAIWPLRATSAIIGLFTLLIFYGFARQVLPRNYALLAVFVLAIFPWHIHFSRLGFRTILAPLFVSAAGWALAVWMRREAVHGGKQILPAVTTGILLGLALYSYTAVNALPVAVFITLIISLFINKSKRTALKSRSAIFFVAAFIVIFGPLLFYYFSDGSRVLGRVNQVAPGSAEFSWRDNTLGLLLFFGGLSGDSVFKHGPPFRPMFELFFVAFFWLGVIGLLFNWRRRSGIGIYLLLTLLGFIAVSFLSDHAPNKLRMAGAIPVVVLCFTEGLRRFATTLRILGLNRAATCFAIGVVLAHWSWSNASAHWYGWHRNAAIYNQFSGPFTQTGLWAQGAIPAIPATSALLDIPPDSPILSGASGGVRDYSIPVFIPSAIANHATVRYLTAKTPNVFPLIDLKSAITRQPGQSPYSYLLLTSNAPNNARILGGLKLEITEIAQLSNPINGTPWGTWLLIRRRATPLLEEEQALLTHYLTDR